MLNFEEREAVWMQRSEEGKEPTGPHLGMCVMQTGKGVPAKVAQQAYKVVCFNPVTL